MSNAQSLDDEMSTKAKSAGFAPHLFVTGAVRSGTSLMDKLLSMHPNISVLSQPLPRLYVETKRRFLRDGATPFEQEFPMNDLFDDAFRPPTDFTAFLKNHQFQQQELIDILAKMDDFLGNTQNPRYRSNPFGRIRFSISRPPSRII